MTADSSHNVFLYGVSYGSYWAQRYLMVAPNQATKVAIDGICPPDVCRLADYYDVNTNIVGEDFMTLCAEQSISCKKHLGDFPMEELALLMELVASGKQNCSQELNVTHTMLRNLWGSQLMSEYFRILIPPTVKRLLRCTETDVAELKHMLAHIANSNRVLSSLNSTVLENLLLGYNIALSEMYSIKRPPPPLSYFLDLDDSLFFSVDVSTEEAYVYDQWPRYNPNDTFGYNQYPVNASTPLMLIEGELDPQTSHAWALHAMQHYTQGQHLISVPYAPHGAVFFSPSSNSSLPCGARIVSSWFLTDTFNTSCLGELTPPDFEGVTAGAQELSKQFFGTESLWGA